MLLTANVSVDRLRDDSNHEKIMVVLRFSTSRVVHLIDGGGKQRNL
jgi:hypothetical protein